jgi:hypothetical protein
VTQLNDELDVTGAFERLLDTIVDTLNAAHADDERDRGAHPANELVNWVLLLSDPVNPREVVLELTRQLVDVDHVVCEVTKDLGLKLFERPDQWRSARDKLVRQPTGLDEAMFAIRESKGGICRRFRVGRRQDGVSRRRELRNPFGMTSAIGQPPAPYRADVRDQPRENRHGRQDERYGPA